MVYKKLLNFGGEIIGSVAFLTGRGVGIGFVYSIFLYYNGNVTESIPFSTLILSLTNYYCRTTNPRNRSVRTKSGPNQTIYRVKT